MSVWDTLLSPYRARAKLERQGMLMAEDWFNNMRADRSQGMLGSQITTEGEMRSGETFDQMGNPIFDRATVQQPRTEMTGFMGSDRGPIAQAQLRQNYLDKGYTPQDVNMILSQVTGASEPTTLQRQFEYYQGLPGPQQQSLMDFRQSGTPSTNINLGPKLPTGYQWKDPNDTSKGVVPIQGGPVTKPSAAEAKQLGQAEMSQGMLDEIRAGINAGVDVSNPLLWAESEVAAMPVFSWMTGLSPDEAKVASNLRQFENQFLAMMRGAQVGPAEQKLFRKQLPQLGQSDELFEANFTASQKNLKTMVDRMSQMRNIAPAPQGQGLPVPPGWEEY